MAEYEAEVSGSHRKLESQRLLDAPLEALTDLPRTGTLYTAGVFLSLRPSVTCVLSGIKFDCASLDSPSV